MAWDYKMSKASRGAWRNVIATAICMVAWTSVYLIPATVGATVISPMARLAALPIVIGIALALALTGAWSEKVAYVFAAPVPSILFFGVSFSVGTDPEGSAFAWMLVGLPLLPYLVAALGTVAVLEFCKSRSPRA
jgi:hypothetical protein